MNEFICVIPIYLQDLRINNSLLNSNWVSMKFGEVASVAPAMYMRTVVKEYFSEAANAQTVFFKVLQLHRVSK